MLLKLYLFGSPHIVQNDEIIPFRRRKGLALLTYLAVTQQPQSRETLLGLLWPEFSTEKARNNLRRELSLLKKHFDEPFFLADANQVRLDPAAQLWVDVLAFQATIEELSATAVPTITRAQAAEQLAAAVDLYSDDFMAGFSLSNCLAFEEWQELQAAQLRQMLNNALAALVKWHEKQAAYEVAIRYAQRWLSLDTLHEPVHRQLMRLYALTGQQAAALRQYEECARILEAELGVPTQEETTRLFEAIHRREFPAAAEADNENKQPIPSSPPPATHAPQFINKLPIPPTPFIGRTEEVAEIRRRLEQPACRLLSLIGPGGIGKTRLSLAVAEQFSASAHLDFNDGVFFVPLQPVTAATNIPSAIAEAIKFRFQGDGSAWQQLRRYLQQQQILLVLDNFEHLLEGAHYVAEILAHCQQVKLLVTSREALNLREEWFHPITGLRYTIDTGARDNTAKNGTDLADAAKLFAHHATRVQANFDLDKHQGDVMQICQMVEGVPLAIELAAVWLRVLKVTDIVGELERGLDILTGYERDLPERHRSMQFVLQQSWQMLSQSEQQSLAKLSVFHGGFTREAAQAVAAASYPILVMLVNKSWLQLKEERYQIHELLRQFLSQKLGRDPAAEQTAQAEHCHYYLYYLAQHTKILNGPEQQQALLDIERELDNVRVAWAVGVGQKNLDALAPAVEPLYEMYAISSRYEEASHTFRQAIVALEALTHIANLSLPEKVLATILVRQADISIHLGQNTEAASYLRQAHTLPLSSQDKAWSYKLLGDVALAQGDSTTAKEHFQSGLALSREIGDEATQTNCLDGLSVLTTSFGEFESGQRLAIACVESARRLGRPDYIARALGILAWATNGLGDYEQSEAYWHESLAICQSIDDKRGIARALNFLGWELWSQGGDGLAAAREYHEEAIIILRKLGSRSHLVMALADYGLVTNELGDFATTAQVCAEGMIMAEEAGMPHYVGYNQTCLGVAQAGLGQVEKGIDQIRGALKNHLETEQTPQCLLSLYYLLLLLTRYPDQGQRLNLSQHHVFDMVRFVAQHPLNYHPIRDRAKLLQARLAETNLTETAAPAPELTLELIVSTMLGKIDS